MFTDVFAYALTHYSLRGPNFENDVSAKLLASPSQQGPTRYLRWCPQLHPVISSYNIVFMLPVVPHKAVAEVSKIGNL